MLDRTFGPVLTAALFVSGAASGCTQEIRGIEDEAVSQGVTSNGPASTSVPVDTSMPGSDTTGDRNGGETEADGSSGSDSGGAQTSSSDGGGALCGDGVIQGSEECDCGEGNVCAEKELGGIGCVALDPDLPGVVTGGVLLCDAASCRYDTSSCFYCGDGYLNGNETCEDGFEIETSCEGLGLGLGELTCGNDCQLDTSDCNACDSLIDFDDGDCPGDWTTGRTTGMATPTTWECGVPNGFEDGPGFGASRMLGTRLDGAYANGESGYFASPAIDLGECSDQNVALTITHWFNFGTGDGGIVQAATADPDEESSWTTIEPVSGSFYSATVAASHPPVAGNAAFSALDPAAGTWVDAVFDVTEFAGEDEFYIRFVFGSDGSNVSGGWYVDTIEIRGDAR